MKRRLLAMILALTFVVGLIPSAAASETDSEAFGEDSIGYEEDGVNSIEATDSGVGDEGDESGNEPTGTLMIAEQGSVVDKVFIPSGDIFNGFCELDTTSTESDGVLVFLFRMTAGDTYISDKPVSNNSAVNVALPPCAGTVEIGVPNNYTGTAVLSYGDYTFTITFSSDFNSGNEPGEEPSGTPDVPGIYTVKGTNYQIGFGTFSNDGATFYFDTYRNSTTSINESSDEPRYLMPELTVCAAERKETAGGEVVYDVISDENAPLSINVTKMELRHFDDSDIFSFSDDKNGDPVLVKTSDFVTTQSILGKDQQIPNSAYYYVTLGEAGKVAIVATVELTMGGVTTTVEVGMTFEMFLTKEEEWSRPDGDTTEAINEFLAGCNIESDAVYKLYLDTNAVYGGTIQIPANWNLSNKNSTLEIYGNGAKVTGGIDLGGEDIFRIQDIYFEKAADYTEGAVRNGASSLWRCTFIGYDTAVDATRGLIIPRVANIFVANKTAWELDLTPEGGLFGGTSEMQNNTFVLNGTAVHISGDDGQSQLPIYYFRIFNSNFIQNDTDFHIGYAGNFYMQQNFFGTASANINKNNVEAAKEFAEDLRSADGQESLNDLVERRKAKLSGQADVFVDPCWALPVFTVGKVDDSFDAYKYGNYLTIDGKENQDNKHTRISNEWADRLIVDDSAFGDDNITIDVADGQENVVGIWNFG